MMDWAKQVRWRYPLESVSTLWCNTLHFFTAFAHKCGNSAISLRLLYSFLISGRFIRVRYCFIAGLSITRLTRRGPPVVPQHCVFSLHLAQSTFLASNMFVRCP